MKNLVALTILFCSFFSCKKNDDTPNPVAVPTTAAIQVSEGYGSLKAAKVGDSVYVWSNPPVAGYLQSDL